MDERDTIIRDFLAGCGWGDATRKKLAGDASGRRYERLTKHGNAVLMDVPDGPDDSIGRFVQLARHLTGLGYSAPQILAEDLGSRLLLIEDFGDAVFARIMEEDNTAEQRLYAAATDLLLALHQTAVPDVPIYGPVEMARKIDLAFDWYQARAIGQKSNDSAAEISAILLSMLKAHDCAKPVLALRDFHAENLIWLPDRQGVARVGLLDFQDAVAGHPAYDLVSVLQDARRDVPPTVEAAMITRYATASNFDRQEFKIAYALQGVQRNLRILGVFARLSAVAHKPAYIDLIPRVWQLLCRNLRHPELAQLASLIEKALPAPDNDVLKRLKFE